MSNIAVDDATFEEAWANPQYRKTMYSASRKYRGFMSSDEREQLMRIALWQTLMSHDDKYGRKFRSSLWRRTTWLCQDQARATTRRQRLAARICHDHPNQLHDEDWTSRIDDEIDAAEEVASYIKQLNDAEWEVVERRDVQDMSVAKIAASLRMSKRTVGTLYDDATLKLRYVAGVA